MRLERVPAGSNKKIQGTEGAADCCVASSARFARRRAGGSGLIGLARHPWPNTTHRCRLIVNDADRVAPPYCRVPGPNRLLHPQRYSPAHDHVAPHCLLSQFMHEGAAHLAERLTARGARHDASITERLPSDITRSSCERRCFCKLFVIRFAAAR